MDDVRFREVVRGWVPGGNDALKRLVVQMMPTAILPILEAGINYSAFRDGPIVSPWDTDLPTDQQYTQWTSETAKRLGKVLPVPPAYIDHIVFGYTSNVGRTTLESLDTVLGSNRPAKSLQQLPVLGALSSDGSFGGNAQSIQDLYDIAEAFDTLKASTARDIKAGRPEDAKERVREARAELPMARREAILAARAQFKALGTTIKAIHAAPPQAMSPAEKRDRINKVRERMVDIAREALGRPALEARRTGVR